MREITLGLEDGETTVPVYEQSVAYLVRRVTKLGLTLTEAADLAAAGDVVAFFGDRTYEALCAVIPNLSKRMTKEQFWPADLLDEDADEEQLKQAPSMTQIRHAFKVAAEVSGFDILKTLYDALVDPQTLKRAANAVVAERLSNSLSSPPPNGESRSESSGTTPPVSTETVLSASAA